DQLSTAMSARPQPPEQIHEPPPAEARPLAVAVPIDVRSTSLAVLALIGSIVFLHWAQAVLIPITFAVLLSYALTPVVNWLRRRAGLHKAIGAALTLAVLVGGVGFGLSSLRPQIVNIINLGPRLMQKHNVTLHEKALTEPRANANM